jgi:hypothetical protein
MSDSRFLNGYSGPVPSEQYVSKGDSRVDVKNAGDREHVIKVDISLRHGVNNLPILIIVRLADCNL